MLNLNNPMFDGSTAKIEYNSSAPITYASLQICIHNAQCMANVNLTYGGVNGVATYNFTTADHDLLVTHPQWDFKFSLMNSNDDYVTYQPYLLVTPTVGDTNFDGEINVVDIVQIVNSILGQGNQIVNQHLADYNRDGTVNVIDIVAIVDQVLGPMSTQGQQIINRVRGNRGLNTTPTRPRGPRTPRVELGRSGKPLVNNRQKITNSRNTLIKQRTGKGNVYVERKNPRGDRGRG